MKKDRIINPALIAQAAALGHTEYLVIADAGLPIPKGVPTVDLSLVAGVPGYLQVLEALEAELVSEGYILAMEITEKNPVLYAKTGEILKGRKETLVPHETFKELTKQAKAVVRTGETSSYANVILIGGVNF